MGVFMPLSVFLLLLCMLKRQTYRECEIAGTRIHLWWEGKDQEN